MNRVRVVLAYDESAPANTAIDAGAALMPRAHAWITHLWTPPYASEPLRHRLWRDATGLDDFVAAIDREGAAEADRIAATGATLATASGWQTEPLVERTYGGEGFQLVALAERVDADVIIVGSRGLSGVPAVLSSVSDVVAHYATRPVLTVPHPLLTAERDALAAGPALMGWDGSPTAQATLDHAESLLGGRPIILATIADGTQPDIPPPRESMQLTAAAGHLTRTQAIAETLAAAARHCHAAVIVVGSRGRSASREILLGSVAMATAHHAHRPVLVIRHATTPSR